MNQFIDWRNVTIEDLQANPKKFGLPTFKEFCKSRDKWFGREDDSMVTLTEGPKNHRAGLEKIIYQIHGVNLNSEEAVEKALGDHGFSLADIDLEKKDAKLKKSMNIIPKGAGKYDIVVNFLP